MKPETRLTAFDFTIQSFEELPAKLKEHVGYEVKPIDVWSMSITDGGEPYKLRVTLTIIYWSEKRVKERANEIINF